MGPVVVVPGPQIAPRPLVGTLDVLPGPIMPVGLEWLQDWVTKLNDATDPPTPESLLILAEALLGQGYADEALQISR